MTERTESRWTPADLDRCQHGRHSIDDCLDCPFDTTLGRRLSTGNLFLASTDRELRRGQPTRIGTDRAGNPIIVTPVRHPRGYDPTEEHPDA